MCVCASFQKRLHRPCLPRLHVAHHVYYQTCWISFTTSLSSQIQQPRHNLHLCVYFQEAKFPNSVSGTNQNIVKMWKIVVGASSAPNPTSCAHRVSHGAVRGTWSFFILPEGPSQHLEDTQKSSSLKP